MLRVRACAALAALLAAACGERVDTPPNLLLVTVDTLRADRLACYGGPEAVGRAMCSLADAGTRFEWALSAAPYTAPSIASVLTSLYPAQHGVTQHAVSFLESPLDSVAEVLHAAGYTTAAFVSNPVLEPGRSLNQGFEVYDIRLDRHERNRPHLLERAAEDTTEAVLAWARVGAREPWFVWVHYQDPHGPYEPPDAVPAGSLPAADSGSEGGARLPLLEDQSGYGGIPAYQELPGVFTPSAYERRYLEEVQYLDAAFARLVEGLDALGRRPAILLTADHGEAFGEDGYWFAHGHSVGLDQVRVPLLWRPPRPAAPTVVSEPVSLLDVAPTLAAAAGLEPVAQFRGQPLPLAGLAAEAAGADRPGERPIFVEQSHQAAIVVGRAYYARERDPDAPRRRDPVSGGLSARIPARTARLAAGAAQPAYEPVAEAAGGERGPEETLEPLLSEFLAAGRGRDEAPTREVSEESRARLRALGYLE